MNPAVLQGHASANRLQTLLLVGALLSIGGLAGFVLFGESGLWLALVATLFILVMLAHEIAHIASGDLKVNEPRRLREPAHGAVRHAMEFR